MINTRSWSIRSHSNHHRIMIIKAMLLNIRSWSTKSHADQHQIMIKQKKTPLNARSWSSKTTMISTRSQSTNRKPRSTVYDHGQTRFHNDQPNRTNTTKYQIKQIKRLTSLNIFPIDAVRTIHIFFLTGLSQHPPPPHRPLPIQHDCHSAKTTAFDATNSFNWISLLLCIIIIYNSSYQVRSRIT